VSTRKVSRRRAIQYGLGAAGAGSMLGAAASARWQARSTLAQVATPVAGTVELPQPNVLSSVGGELALNLTATPGTVDMRAPLLVKTYTYDNVVPGHTWEIRPGDTLRIDLINNLPPLSHDEPVDPVRPHEWTTTNLHTHGLHVSPAGNGDNVFLAIPPGERQAYEIRLPDDHPSGIYWYHPHRHGGVAQQVRAGMAGMIVVRGEIDEVEEVRAAKEQIMVMQAIELGDELQLLDPIPHPGPNQAFVPRSHILYTVNGVLNPTITMYPGEVQRWRMLNAAEGKFMSVALEGHDFNILAWDGLTLAEPEGAELAMLSSGNRVEVLVKAGRPGLYNLMLSPGSSQKPYIPGMPLPASGTPVASPVPTMIDTHGAMMRGLPDIPGELVVRPILTLEVKGEGPEMALPAALPAWDPPMLPIARTRQFAFTVERGEDEIEFIDFGVDGVPFDINRPPYQVKLNTAEEWTLSNGIDTRYPDHAHVYHIHINPFRITKINGRTLDRPRWRDTYVLSGKNGDSLTFESNFTDFTGKFVEHCHVLTHEDLGMMSAIEVVE
jgi:FtsP/CotA-like multicopper oxidase with cupredoxin domain